MLFKYLNDNFGITSENLATLYQYAKFQYECGNYSGASQYLYFYRVLVHDDDKNAASAIWGKLACEILTQNWDAALEDINRLKEIIDGDVRNTSQFLFRVVPFFFISPLHGHNANVTFYLAFRFFKKISCEFILDL